MERELEGTRRDKQRLFDEHGATPEQQVADIEAEIHRCTRRLIVLLADEESGVEGEA